MRIERIELIGFKSFSDKTVFKLHPGTTAIVGPNGCGKSNIVDAFKWVLGEQSAKSLRGGRMEDVIFAGSATKKTKGMAEVTLVLSDIVNNPSNGPDGNDKPIPAEIAVTRRLYRSGESEYLMNKVRCRLKDIKNMFLDTGLELKAYSILEQGRIGDIVNSKPQDRRFLIEEVAGVMKYKIRKHEAMNKLESSKSNLQRLQDIISEVKRQINTINRHAKKAERYKKLFEEVKDIDLRIAKRDSKALQDEISSLDASEDAMKSNEAELSANLHSAEALTEEKKRLCIEHERSLAEIRTRLYSLEKEATGDEGKIALLKSDCENLRERYNTLIRQEKDLAIEKETTADSINNIRADETGMGEKLAVLQNILEEKKSYFVEADDEIIDLEHSIEEQRKNLFNKAEEISNTKNEINRLSLTIENIERKADKSSKDINTLNENLTSVTASMEQSKEELTRFEIELQGTKEAKEGLVNRLNEKKQGLSTTQEFLYSEREDLAGMNSKLESLIETDQSQMSSVDESIRMLCQVADIFETPPEYETAIEAALGDKLGAAIVEGRDEILKALRFIKENNKKRSGFISVNPDGRALSETEDMSLIKSSGVIGRAIKCTSVKDGFERVAASLLNDVCLVNNLSAALSLRQNPSGPDAGPLYLVTLEGEVLDPSGMVFGGADKGVLKIKRLIKELEKGVSEKREKIGNAEKMVSAFKDEIVSTENEIISIDGRISSQEKYCHELNMKISNLTEEDRRLRERHEYIKLEITDDYREKERLQAILAENEQRCNMLGSEKEEIEEKIRAVQASISGKRESLESMRAELTDVKLELTAVREKMASTTREIGRLNAVITSIERKKEEMSNECDNILEIIKRKEGEITEKGDALKSKVVAVSELQAEASEISEILGAKKAELEILEKEQKGLAQRLEAIRSELSQVEMKKMEQSMKLAYLKEDVHKTYAIEIETADISGPVEPEEEEKLAGLKDKIQSLGPVSLGTLDEYEELKSRYEFLSGQRDDLTESISSLEDTIQKINMTSKKRLEDAFEALNMKFKEVFTILFGKGRAELQLTEGSILDAGIEIIAQPPGKRLQNLTLLSGGEKALTALSLLFAGFMIKPTPLCLLDEVDAPLDESNTDRFINLLRELSGDIQFITITHNRRTMEAADYIYGITMEEPGASKVLSMQLAEAESL